MVPQLKNIFRNYLLDSSFILDDSPSPAGHDNRGDTTPAAFKIALAAGQPGRAIIASTLISPAEAQESAETETIGTEDQETVTAFTSPTPGVTDAAAQIPDRPPVKMPLEVQEKHENTWTVQVLATNDQQIADEWMQKLKAKGYEAFVTDAFVRGKHWQRVRVGRLSTLREAEALRSELASTEGLRETFVARNERSEHLLTLNRR
jgi:cell division septation protein DedD